MKPYIAPHAPSEGASLLKDQLGATLIKSEGSKYKYKPNEQHLVINWGSSEKRDWYVNGMKILNDPVKVSKAVNKTETLRILKNANLSVPEFTTNIEEAKGWIKNGGGSVIVFCRTKTRASGGEGIVIAKTVGELVAAPLFTLYKKKKFEFRVAVVKGVVIDYMQKKKRSDWNVELQGEVNQLIRSHDNGWIFAREGVNPPAKVLDLAIKSVKALELDFGSVDIIYNEAEDTPYVLEINSAPGLEEGGTSLERYTKAFKSIINNQKVVALVASPNLPAQVAQAAPAAPVQAAPVAPAPVQAAPTPAPVVKAKAKVINTQNNGVNKQFKLDGLTDIVITVGADKKIKIVGNINGIGRVKVMTLDGDVETWFKEEEND